MPAASTTTPPGATVRLRDGRALGYAEYGSASGTPVFYFHGTLGSRVEAQLLHLPAARLGLRIIGVDRPGHGLSSPHPERSFASWVEDVRELADALQSSRFGVVGLSGGGGHAAVVASALGERVSRVAIVSGVEPPEAPKRGRALGARLGMWLARFMLLHLRLLAWVLSALARRFGPDMFVKLRPLFRRGDARAAAREEVRRAFAEAWVEGTRQGTVPAALDLRLQAAPWNVPLAPPAARVELWYGLRDDVTPPAGGRHYAALWPAATLHELEDEGHLLIGNHVDAILAPFAAEAARALAASA